MKSEKEIKLSVIIVNYNVAYFLEQCLNSVLIAAEKVETEIYVVDNNSVDGSVEMIQEKFPNVHLIANKDNKGFSKANNQALLIAQGEYHLLLNPDTVVEEDTFLKIVDFMDAHPNAGGLGVRMLDGKGNFLPESKRGLPTPAVAFYKIFGISKLFPKSKRFGQYHLGYLSEFETNKIDILSGAFMLMRKTTLMKVGLLDETFFMYGEDIDLSYRIIKGGYDNYYFPETRIIHYKGESTKKSSINYVFVFYRAMVIFAEKHFSKKNAKLFSFLINCAIYLRAGMAIGFRFLKQAFLPIIDFSVVLFILLQASYLWNSNGTQFNDLALKTMLPSYGLIWLICNLYSGTYDFPAKLPPILKGTFIGTCIILVMYALVPVDFRFSRVFILLGTTCVLTYLLSSRYLLHLIIGKRFSLQHTSNKRFVIVGSLEEADRIEAILRQTHQVIDFIGCVGIENDDKKYLGNISQLSEIQQIHKVNEIIFSAKDVSSHTIIQWMSAINVINLDFKIAQPDATFLIGSNSIETAGDLYVLTINSISKPYNRRMKRSFDFLFSFLLICFAPLYIWKIKRPKFFKVLLKIFIGKMSFVGYQTKQLSKVKLGLYTPKYLVESSIDIDIKTEEKINLLYVRDYSLSKDWKIVMNGIKTNSVINFDY
jgi:GT2 family glycosyltransferase